MEWNASAQSTTMKSSSSSLAATPRRAKASETMSWMRGSTIRSWLFTWAFTKDLLMSTMRRSLVVPSARSFARAATFDTTTLPNFACTAAQLGKISTKPLAARRAISFSTRCRCSVTLT